jgi:hypothetical protein
MIKSQRLAFGFDRHIMGVGISYVHKTLFLDFFGLYLNVYLGKSEE